MLLLRSVRAATLLLSALLPSAALAATIDVSGPVGDGFHWVHVSGRLELGDDQRFVAATSSVARAVVVLESDGGRTIVGLSIGAHIRARGFATKVEAGRVCASACGLAWLAGTPRYIESGSRVGFHASFINTGEGLRETGMGNALIGAYLRDLGLPITAIAYVTAAPPEGMQWLSAEDDIRVGINVTVPRAVPGTRPSTGDTVERAVRNMLAELARTGPAGQRNSVEACYAQFARALTLDVANYCFALDYAVVLHHRRTGSGMMDSYFDEGRITTRANWALERLGVGQERRGPLLQAWSWQVEQAIGMAGPDRAVPPSARPQVAAAPSGGSDRGPVPQFRDYPALAQHRGPNAPIVLTTEQRTFRTRLRAAARQRPNFAGRYVLTTWGCGTACLEGAIYDAATGRVINIPFSICCWMSNDDRFEPIEFRVGSRLVVFAGSRNLGGDMGAHFYEFDGVNFRHLRTIPDDGTFRR